MRAPMKDFTFMLDHTLTPRLVEILFSGGLTNVQNRNTQHADRYPPANSFLPDAQ
jgi:hypothetical protein